MYIGIITLSRAHNYGAVLQTYALYNFLRQAGYKVEIIDYITERYAMNDPTYAEKRTAVSRFWGRNKFLKSLWKRIYLNDEIEDGARFFNFLRENVNITAPFYNDDELAQNCPDFDIYITGSDQVWNTDYTWGHKIDKPYYLNFAPDGKKLISYASSFGREEIGESETNEICRYLNRYYGLSVREESATAILGRMGLKSKLVLDPTFLCPPDFWLDFCSCEKVDNKKFLLVFLVNPNSKIIDSAKKIAKTKNLELKVVVSTRINSKRVRCKTCIPSVTQWVAFFRDATYIISDSFHATAFSIQLKKRFLVDCTVRYSTRIKNILSLFSIEYRGVSNLDIDEMIKVLDKDIDYTEIHNRLNELRNDSSYWLIDNIDSQHDYE